MNEDLLPIMSTSFSHEPPGKEVTYFFVIVVILGAVIQPLCNAVAHYTASETKSSRRNDKGTKRKLLYCPFFFKMYLLPQQACTISHFILKQIFTLL